jgi:RimJ/RimL family protein N-acetyltransferase
MSLIEEVEVRTAQLADAPAIAQVHVSSWRSAYAGIVPGDYLDALDVDARTESWTQWLADGPADDVVTWVATVPDLVGFATVGPARDADSRRAEREIYSIYLIAEAWGSGVARELIRTVVDESGARTPLSLWVLSDNERARRFHRRHGFTPDGAQKTRPLGGADLVEVRYRRG